MSENRHAVLGIHGTADGSHEHHAPHRGPILKRAKWTGAIVIGLLLAGAVVTMVMRSVHAHALEKSTGELSRQFVTTVNASTSNNTEPLTLPGTLQGIIESPIYARASGYVLRWKVDIGARVNKGDVLAEIDTPEVDQQLSQAKAELATAKANYALAKSTDERWKGLLGTQSVSRQDADEKAGAAAASKANVDSASANVQRLEELESFKRVVAPFDGVITARRTDVGALINAGQNSGGELFHLADTHKLRIYVQVPENNASAAKVGMKAELHFSEHPGQGYPAEVVRTANALDPAARTLQVELEIDNAKGELFPGAYVEVHFKLPVNAASLRLPANTVLFRSAGLQVAVVGADHHVKLKNVVQGRDFGSTIEVLSGVNAGDSVVLNPPDSLVDGAEVRVVPRSAGAAAPHVKAKP